MFGHELTGNMLGPDPHEYVSLAQLSCGPARETIAPATIAPPNLQENMDNVKVRMQSRRDRAKPWDVAVSQRRHGKQHIMTEDIVFIMSCPDESFRDYPKRPVALSTVNELFADGRLPSFGTVDHNTCFACRTLHKGSNVQDMPRYACTSEANVSMMRSRLEVDWLVKLSGSGLHTKSQKLRS